MKRVMKLFAFALIGLLMTAPAALAHKVNLFAYYEDGKIFTESYFPDGMKVVDGKVEVYDNKNHLVFSGKTDKEGLCSFPFTQKEDVTIKINATMGHKNEFILKKEEME